LFVIHSDGNGYLDACALNKTDASCARAEIAFTWDDVRKTLCMGKLFVMFSGGKDSLCLLAYMKGLCEQTGKEFVALHADTTAGFPEVELYVEKVCKKLHVPLVTVRPPRGYFELAKRWGIPGVRSRWCCSTLKIAPMRRYLAGIDGPKVIFDGIRAAESNIRSTYIPLWYHPSFRAICASPLFGWSDEKVRNYIKKKELPASPAENLGTSAECWCGAYKCRSDFEALLAVHPEIFDQLVEVEGAQNGKYTFLYEKGMRIPLESLRKNAQRSNATASK
jgi:3'-phosphoadenosine 5'-phosphosulfate sulfotransferase (PAPS reductase)/FAD synthetase